MKIPRKASATANEPSKKDIAITAVQEVEEGIKAVHEMESEFEREYPEAVAKIGEINNFKAEIEDKVGKAKILVREAGETIGSFKLTQKKTSPGYDESKMCKIMSELPDSDLAVTFKKLVGAGVIVGLSLDKDATKLFFPRDPQTSELVKEAWDKGGEPLTPAISVPKF